MSGSTPAVPADKSKEKAANQIPEPRCVLIPSGEFWMGSDEEKNAGEDSAGRDEEHPLHRVWIDAFEMAVFQVRNRDFALFLDAIGHTAPPHWNDSAFNDPEQPVVAVSWFEAAKYCDWLSKQTGSLYRLPTEAEWERAARGDREDSRYPWGNEPPQQWPEHVRRWTGKSDGPLRVGEGTPNPFGVYDIGENVHEWCADWFDKNYYARSPERNPQGPATGVRRASRGGSWRHQIKATRCAARSSIPPAFQYADYGFRVVREVSEVSVCFAGTGSA